MQARPHLIVEVVILSAAFRGKNCTITAWRIIEMLLIQSQSWERDFYMRFLLVLWFPLNGAQSRAPSGTESNKGLLKGSSLLCLWAKPTCLGNLLVRWLRLVLVVLSLRNTHSVAGSCTCTWGNRHLTRISWKPGGRTPRQQPANKQNIWIAICQISIFLGLLLKHVGALWSYFREGVRGWDGVSWSCACKCCERWCPHSSSLSGLSLLPPLTSLFQARKLPVELHGVWTCFLRPELTTWVLLFVKSVRWHISSPFVWLQQTKMWNLKTITEKEIYMQDSGLMQNM